MSYKDAAPGDIMLIEEGMTITCDLVLMKGEVLLNEAIITGNLLLLKLHNDRGVYTLIESFLRR